MILTVTLNPCLHKFVKFRGELDGRLVLRPVETEYQGGGKGINAARMIRKLGGDVTALSFAGGPIGDLFVQVVASEGIRIETVRTRAATRMSTMVFGVDTGQFREFLEAGARIEADESRAFVAKFDELSRDAAIITLNGSVPDPQLDTFYADAIARARTHGKRVIVDTYGEAAVLVAAARPYLLKANLDEVRDSFAVDSSDPNAVREFAAQQLANGVENVLLTEGAAGARLFTASGTYVFVPPVVTEVNPVGSGDAMLGVLALELARGKDVVSAVRRATAAGTANAEQLRICDFPPERLDELATRIAVRPA